MNTNLSVVILAAGLGKRMQNADAPKVLALLRYNPLIYYVLNTALQLTPQKICLVVGHKRELVMDYVSNVFNLNYISEKKLIDNSLPSDIITFAVQEEQLGTGHAVLCSEYVYSDYDGKILILSGDVPLLSVATLQNFVNNTVDSNIAVLTAKADNPFGYGRIVRDSNNQITSIVEEKDATNAQKLIKEINSGIYLVDAKLLYSLLKKIKNTNSQNEFYLTDIISIGLRRQECVLSSYVASFNEIQGINTTQQLLELEALL